MTWSECDSQRLYDVAAGTATPNPLVVGSEVKLDMDVIFNNDALVVGNFVKVSFTAESAKYPITLYS